MTAILLVPTLAIAMVALYKIQTVFNEIKKGDQ
jgi:hypothetical protein